MPRPSKRKAISQNAAMQSMIKRRNITPLIESEATPKTPADSLSDDVTEDSDFAMESEVESEGLLTEEEDKYPIGQPEFGWEKAERGLGYSKSRVYKQKTSYHKNKEEIKRRREEKKALSSGIPVPTTQQPKPVWGDISKMFGPRVCISSTPTPTQSSSPALIQSSSAPTQSSSSTPIQSSSSTQQPEPELQSLMVQPTHSDQSLVRPYIPPNFEKAFHGRQSFEFKNEAHELELWLKGQKGKVTGDWLLRVECLRDLLQMQHQTICRGQEAKWNDWVEYSKALARRVKRSPRWATFLRQWEQNWIETRTPPPCPRRGRHVKRKSLFFDEGVTLAVREYLNTAMWRASPRGVCEAVAKHMQSENSVVDIMKINSVLCNSQEGRKGITERTANRWLLRLGWVYQRNKKGYCDGHERQDIVEYREKVFCPRMKVSSRQWLFLRYFKLILLQEIFKTLREFDDSGEILLDHPLPPNTKRRHLVTHDESTFNANDSTSYSWKKAGTEWLKPKSRGKGIMVSDFLCAAYGRLHYIDESQSSDSRAIPKKIFATEVIKYGSGKNDDGWWNAEKMIEQTKKAIAIFNQAFPGDVAVFAFDNSSGHACKAKNALVANRMNLRPGGKQPRMRDTKWGNGIHQSMVFQEGDKEWGTDIPISRELIGQAKGMKRVLQERGLWREGLKKQCGRPKKERSSNFEERLFQETLEQYEARIADRCQLGKNCCALRILEDQDDFRNEISLLETIIQQSGHEVIFYPKFHCELNYIEYYWAALKRYTRENCKYSFLELEQTVLEAMDSVSLKTIRRFAMRSKRWMWAYMNGLTEEQRNFAERAYVSHRRETRHIFV